MRLPYGRRSIRLRGFNYGSARSYFVTLCIRNKRCLFGRIGNERMLLSPAGRMVATEWESLVRLPGIALGRWVVMPNHLHGIVRLTRPAPRVKGLSAVIGGFKSRTTVAYCSGVRRERWPRFEQRLWQRNYWEHIIRDERASSLIDEYIWLNPKRWRSDPNHPRSTGQVDPHASWL